MHRLTREALKSAASDMDNATIARRWGQRNTMRAYLRSAADAMARAIETERFYGRLSAINQRQDYARAMAAEDSGIRWEDEHPATITDHVAAFQATQEALPSFDEPTYDSEIGLSQEICDVRCNVEFEIEQDDFQWLERIETRAIKLEAAAQDVVAAWEHGDLAHAVRQLVVALKGDA